MSKLPSSAQELDQVDRGEVAGGVVEEHVLRAIVDDEPAGHEVMRGLLGEVEHVRLASRLEKRPRQ